MMRQKQILALSILMVVCSLAVFMGACSETSAHSSTNGINILDAKNKENLVPVAILGSGPAGLSSAIYAVRGGMKALVIHGPMPGGLLTQTSLVENWPGNKEIEGPDIIKSLTEQVQGLAEKAKDVIDHIEFVNDTVTALDLAHWPYALTMESGVTIHALAIIFATGATPKLLGIPGEKEFWKNGVTTCAVCDGPFYKGQDVVVIGGGDSAAEEAMQLAHHAKTVTVLVRKEAMRASVSMQNHLKEYPSIKIMYNVEPRKIVGANDEVTGVELYNSKTKETSVFPTNGVFLAIGHTPNSALVKSQITMDQEGYIIPRAGSQETNVPGFFVAGDVADRKYRQAGSASGRGIEAGIDAVNFLTAIGYNTTMAQELAPQFYVAKK